MNILSRKQAQQQGLTYYYTGKACKHGHISKRFVVSGVCYECHQNDGIRQYQKDPQNKLQKTHQWYNNNKQYILAQSKQRYWSNPQRHLTRCRRYYSNNRELVLSMSKKWAQAHPEKSIQYHCKRKLRIPSWSLGDPRITKLYEHCSRLNKQWNTNFEVDHVLPLRGKLVSGLHVFENLQLLDRTLNIKKGNK